MFIINIAGINIKIINKYRYVKDLCRNYIVKTKDYAFEIRVTDEEINGVKNESDEETTLGYCEAIAMYRKICWELLNYDRIFLHSSVIEVDGKCYCISANSGVGKSTHTALWLEYFKDRARVINGDKPILEVGWNSLIAYGTPWCGKEDQNINTSSKVKAICFLERNKKNSISEITYSEAFKRLLSQMEYPKDRVLVNKMFDMLEMVLKNTKFYLLKCNMDVDAAKVAYEGMNKGGYMKIKEGLVVRKFKDDYVAVGTGKLVNEFPNYLIFNEVGKDILEVLKYDINKKEMIDELQKKYSDVKRKEVEENVDKFLELLRNCNLLEE